MKAFSIWLGLTVLVFGGSSVAYHWYLQTHPQKILVAVDTSFPMQLVWQQVPQVLQQIGDQRYATFSVVTDKNKIQSWSPQLNLGTVVPYAPRDFSKFTGSAKYPEIDAATQKYLITTNLEASQMSNLKGWAIIQLSP